jgi:hypothetical protein
MGHASEKQLCEGDEQPKRALIKSLVQRLIGELINRNFLLVN